MVIEGKIEFREERRVEVRIPGGRERRVVGSYKIPIDLVRGRRLAIAIGRLERAYHLNARA